MAEQLAADTILGATADPTYVQAGPQAFLGLAGIAAAVVFANIGSAYGTMKASVGICSVAINSPAVILKSIVPVIMAGILGVYGLIVGVILITRVKSTDYDYYSAYKHFASGLCCGLSSLAAGYAIGITGDAGVRANLHEGKVYVGMLLMLIFSEALGLYGLIVSLILTQ